MKQPCHSAEKRALSILFLYNVIVVGLMWLAYPKLPSRMVSHFNFYGEPDRTIEKTLGFIIISIILVLIPILMPLIRRADPKQNNYTKFESTYIWFGWALSVFLQAIFGIVIAYHLVRGIPIQSFILTALGLFWMFSGNMLGRIRFNYFFGIRTPWTLTDEHVWRRTHRLASKVWFAAGLLACIGAWLPTSWGALMGIIGIGVSALVPIIFSYYAFRSNVNPR